MRAGRLCHHLHFLLGCLLAVSDAVYFGQQHYSFCLPSASSKGAVIGRVFVFVHRHDNCSLSELAWSAGAPINVNSSGWLTLSNNMSASVPDAIFSNVTARCPAGDQASIAWANIEISINPATQVGDEASGEMTSARINDTCFHGAPKSMFIEENTSGRPIIGLINTCHQAPGVSATYDTSKPNKFVIDPDTLEIRLVKALDREKLTSRDTNSVMSNIHGIQFFYLTCTLTKDGVTYEPVKRLINVTVINVNDNAPIFLDHNSARHIFRDVQVDTDNANISIEEVIIDEDNNSLVFAVTNDPLRVCRADLYCLHPPPTGKVVCRLNIVVSPLRAITGTLYRCTVAVTDETHVRRHDGAAGNASATITVNIHKKQTKVTSVQPLTDPVTFTFFRNSTRLARLTQLRSAKDKRPVRYTLEDNGVFRITPSDGIIYLDNTDGLSRTDDTLRLNVHVTGGTAPLVILVSLVGTPRDLTACDGSCASARTTSECEGSCGLGLGSRTCTMRGSDLTQSMSKDYATCTHSMATCPDHTCDELERQYSMLCPQDCVQNGSVVGLFVVDKPSGIKMAVGSCYCVPVDYDYHDYSPDDIAMECSCMPRIEIKATENGDIEDKNKTSSTTGVDKVNDGVTSSFDLVPDKSDDGDGSTPNYNQTDQSHILALATSDSHIMCDNACGTAIGLGLGAFITVSFTLFMLWYTKKRNDRRKSNMKHVGSVVSMSAVPSDYVEERERRLSYQSPQWSPKGPMYTSHFQSLQNENSKWEIPRDKLTLAKTLGEGEFGVVVKARAVGLDGDNSERDVAVKMLKHCSTQLEEQDLWSEFNLLKDVSHPNVIRLLGACTEDGPFYVIVEYCEHGCLLNYLRRSRLEENGYVNSRMRFKSPNPKEQTDPDLEGNLLSTRDLLSFAWQISKGMAYLSEIKLVHRDLAARNVLVASGNVLKISDFGLTRDVYEADTYLKKSRGRIPVKWLAPESLYAQIYTTRSDVWSYGIVLWEIATLGAPPYPGIPPERLYNLLIGGYRMDRPENCPDEMYAVMQKCWKIDAAERPSFQTLASIFDRILQEKTGYLDLNQPSRQDLYRKCFSPESQGCEVRTAIMSPGVANAHQTVVDIVTCNVPESPPCSHNLHTVCNETYNDSYLVPTVTKPQETPCYLDVNVEAKTDSEPVPSTDKNSPVFKRKVPDKGNHVNIKSSKNKHVIYPSEKLSLLMENGTARFSNVNDVIEDVITIEEC